MRRDSHYSLLQLVLNIIKWSWNQLWNKWYALLASYCWTVRTYWYSHHNNRPNLCFKAKLSAKPLIWKWSFILMQIKLIIARKVLNLASVWKWEFLELANWPVCRLFPSNSVSRSNVASIHTAENIRDQNTQLFYFRIFF